MNPEHKHSPKERVCPAEYKPDKERAKRVLVEILRIADGEIDSTTRLYKAFYYAHLWYAQNSPGYLTDWPIVKMQRGPGIGNAEELIAEMISEKLIEVERRREGPFNSNHYKLASCEMPGLAPDEIDAIKHAVHWMNSMSAAELSEITHEHSRSWNLAVEGQELNIYIDLLNDEEYDTRMARMNLVSPIIDEIWGS